MSFEKGISGNPEGRPVGSRNKTTKELQDKMRGFISDNLDTLQQEYDKLSPTEKLKFMASLIQYVVPKPKEEEEPKKIFGRNETYNFISNQYLARKTNKVPTSTPQKSDN